ncbi:hypothetical protein TNCV_135151 [Trichonephila clavipes]|nr:hypothetical protein TNCV_135151 [Trichonephila clavipes]
MTAPSSSFIPTPLAHADNQRDGHPRGPLHIGAQRDLIYITPRSIGDGHRNFEPRSSDGMTAELTHPSPNFHTNMRTLNHDRFNVHRRVFSGIRIRAPATPS